jgi:hypothetical protein
MTVRHERTPLTRIEIAVNWRQELTQPPAPR